MRIWKLLVPLAMILILAAAALPGIRTAYATPQSVSIEMQGEGLNIAVAGVGLDALDGVGVDLAIIVPGTVIEAHLYWAGRDFPCQKQGPKCKLKWIRPNVDL